MEDSKDASSSGWGWGGWGGSALSILSDLHKSAAGVAEEISKNALAVAKGAAKGVVDSINDSQISNTADDSTDGLEPESKEDKLKKTTLERLEGASEDSLLGLGLKAFDSSVQNFASGAQQALGTAWKGSIDLVHQLEHSSEHLAEAIQKQGGVAHNTGFLASNLIEAGKSFTAKGLKVLEYVGKETIDFIVSETGMEVESDEKDSKNKIAEDDENFGDIVTFDRCFYIYGGPEHLEELEALSNHYTLLCNRARAKLLAEQKGSFDMLLHELQHILRLAASNDEALETHNKGKKAETFLAGSGNDLKVLRDSSISKAAEMATGFTTALGALPVTELVKKTADRLEALRAEGVHRISELCALGISHLFALGKSVLSAYSSDESQDLSSIDWPADCFEKAKLIRAQAQTIAADIEAISDSFITGIGDVTAAFQAAIKSHSGRGKEIYENDVRQELMKESDIEDKSHTATTDLQHDGSTAIEKIQDGLQYLIFVVLSTSINN